jgi:hypothetical protein
LTAYARELSALQGFAVSSFFRVSVPGRHFPGADALINSLLERELLPMLPLLPGRVAYLIDTGGETAEFFFEDASSLRLAIPLPAEEADRIAGQKLTHIHIHIKDEWLEKDQILFSIDETIDSPDKLSLELYPGMIDSDAVLFLVDATMPMSLLEREMLTNLVARENIPHIVVVISKLGQVAGGERKVVLEYIKNRLSGIAAQIPIVILGEGLDGESDLGGDLSGEGLSGGDVFAAREGVGVAELKQNIAIWAADELHQGLKAKSIARHLVLLIERIEMELIIKKVELTNQDETRRRELLAMGDKIEQRRLIWEEISISVKKRANDCMLWLREALGKQMELTLTRLQYELSKSRNPGEWWKNDLSQRLKMELQVFVQGTEKNLEARVLDDISRSIGQVRQLCDRQMQMTGPKNMVSMPAFDIDPAAEGLKNINKARDIVRIITGSVAVASYFIIGPFGPLVSVAGGLIGEKLMDGDIKQQREGLALVLHSRVTELFNRVYAGAAGNIKIFYEDAAAAIRVQESEWVAGEQTVLQQRASTRDPELLSTIQLVETLENIKLALQ